MIRIVGLSIGAGLAAALLFAVVLSGSPAGMLLCYVAPVPILIVALGWTHHAGLLAAAAGAAVLSFALGSRAGLAFAFGSGFPAWFIAYLALLGRRSEAGDEWFPLHRLLAWIGATAAFVALASTIALGRGDAERFRASLRALVEAILRAQFGVRPPAALPTVAGLPGADFVDLLVVLAPAVAAGVFVLAFTIDLWIAGKAVALSGRLPRPWPAIAAARMPPVVLGAAVGAGLLAATPGYPGIAGAALCGGLGMAFALQGLAFLHAFTAGRPARRAVLGLVYISAIFFGATALPVLALIGMADSALPIRERLGFAARPDPS